MTITIGGKEISGVTADGSKVQEITVDGNVVWRRTTTSPGDGNGGTQTTPTQPPADRASQAGLTINTTKQVSSMSEIGGADNTMYIVDGSKGTLSHNGKHNLGTVNDVAICGINGAKLNIPANFRDYSLTMSGGSGFLWSGIDLDQSASNAFGRLNTKVNTNATIEFMKTIGKGRRTSGSYPSSGQPALFPAALNSGGTTTVQNVKLVHGGKYAPEHTGKRPIGIFFGTQHKGTLRVKRSVIEEFPNNAIYATNTPGAVEGIDCRLWNNGVSNGRIAHGEFINCTAGYDYKNTGMANADAPNHGTQGFATEDKGHGSNVDLTGCTVKMVNVAKSGGGADVRSGSFGRVEDCDFHTYNGDGAPDIVIDGSCDAIVNCTFKGTEDSGVCVDNNGPAVTVRGNSFDYPAGRSNYSGPIS